jgi:hypothetical protein
VPVILASDKTQLSTFSGDKQAWPVYLTIGNIKKSVRRKPSMGASMLLAYLPVTKLACFPKDKRGIENNRIFHDCMREILAPLKDAGLNGEQMLCPDEHYQQAFPILSSYVADYPEQCMVACCQENQCPICTVPSNERGEFTSHTFREVDETLKALDNQADLSFKSLGLRPVKNPFWSDLPYTDIFDCFTPDLLHQLHKGVFKDHLVKWCTESASANEIDQRFIRLPPHYATR